jgi:hypothetical protein
MPNTVIQLKKSSTPGSSPSSGNLANGELAINFADGVIYYKNLVGQVAQFIAPGRNFGTVNANGTLLVSAIAGDVFTILPGQNITVTGDAVNDRVTIGADLTSANGWANLVGSSANASSSANDATQGANIAVLAAAFVSNSQSLSANVNILAAAISSGGLANTSGVSFNGNLYFPTGNVGIGTSNPQAALDVYNASRFALRLTGPVSNGPIFDLYRQNTRTAFIETDSSNNFILAVVQQGPSLSLRTNGGAGPVNRLLIDTSGNVAIGTATANAKLDIGGDATNKIRLSSSSDSANFYSEFINYYNSGKAFEITHGGVSFLRTAQQGYYNVEFGPAQYHWRTNYGDGYISANTNSAERMRITSTGRVGIGTIGPTARLHVTGAASTTALLIEGQGGANYYVDYLGTGANYSDATTHYFRGNAGNGTWMVLSNGNVGIGNTAPDAKLHVAGTTILGGDTVGTMDVKFSRLLSGTRVINHWFSHSANSPWYLFGQNMTWTGERTGTVDPTHAHRPYYEAYAPVVGYKEFGFANVSSGSIASSNLIANMVLTNTGNIGMGTLAPTEKLHVVGNILLPHSTANTGAIVGAGSSDNFTTNGVIMPHYGMKWASPNDSAGPTGFLSAYYGLRFFVAGSEAMRIDANTRNIGIGTTAPSTKLHVKGTVNGNEDLLTLEGAQTGTGVTGILFKNSGSPGNSGAIRFGPTAQDPNGGRSLTFLGDVSGTLTERMRIDANGNMGIGTTTPLYAYTRLHIARTGYAQQVLENTTDSIRGEVTVYDTTLPMQVGTITSHDLILSTASVRRIVISSSGRVGVGTGTNSLFVPLTVSGGSQDQFEFSSSSTTYNGGVIEYINRSSSTNRPDMTLYVGASNSNIKFAAAGAERMRITSTGDIGIGTTSPLYKLHVNGSFAANTKSFVIDHPTKPGMKLRYGSLEGPENGVYVRGKLDGIKVIELPDYWEGLVDLNTITVQLTAIGHAQNLYVAAIDGLKIHIDTENHTQPYCYYTVYGERKDVEKLVVEFEA